MMRYQIKMTYCNPEQLAVVDGILSRVRGSPTRPATKIDSNTWWEDVEDRGPRNPLDCIVRLTPTYPCLTINRA